VVLPGRFVIAIDGTQRYWSELSMGESSWMQAHLGEANRPAFGRNVHGSKHTYSGRNVYHIHHIGQFPRKLLFWFRTVHGYGCNRTSLLFHIAYSTYVVFSSFSVKFRPSLTSYFHSFNYFLPTL